jgi:protoporphyrinogen oxidase
MQEFDYIIIGGGISGLTFARLLQLHTTKTFIVLEKSPEIGGLCRTKVIDGNAFDVGGGHFLHSKHEKVYDFIFSHIPKSEFNSFVRNTKIDIHDTLVDFPLEENLWQLPVELQLKYVDSILDDTPDMWKSPETFKEWVIEVFGKLIAENYLFPYNEKMWGVALDDLSTDWLYKLPKTDKKSIFHSLILKKANRKNLPSHDYFYYPKEGGFQRIVDAIYEPVKDSVVLNYNINSITENRDCNYDLYPNKWNIDNKYYSKNIINTAPWHSLSIQMPGIFTDNRYFFDRYFNVLLPNMKATNLNVTYKKGQYKTDVHWTYVPDLDIDHHRIFYVNNYAINNPDSYRMTETHISSRLPNGYHDYGQTGGYHTFFNKEAYPIPLKGKNEAMKEILSFYSDKNFYGLGRWGTWQHHNSDVCIFEAMELLNRLEGTTL